MEIQASRRIDYLNKQKLKNKPAFGIKLDVTGPAELKLLKKQVVAAGKEFDMRNPNLAGAAVTLRKEWSDLGKRFSDLTRHVDQDETTLAISKTNPDTDNLALKLFRGIIPVGKPPTLVHADDLNEPEKALGSLIKGAAEQQTDPVAAERIRIEARVNGVNLGDDFTEAGESIVKDADVKPVTTEAAAFSVEELKSNPEIVHAENLPIPLVSSQVRHFRPETTIYRQTPVPEATVKPAVHTTPAITTAAEPGKPVDRPVSMEVKPVSLGIIQRQVLADPETIQALEKEALGAGKALNELSSVFDMLGGNISANIRITKVLNPEQIPTFWHKLHKLMGTKPIETLPQGERFVISLEQGDKSIDRNSNRFPVFVEPKKLTGRGGFEHLVQRALLLRNGTSSRGQAIPGSVIKRQFDMLEDAGQLNKIILQASDSESGAGTVRLANEFNVKLKKSERPEKKQTGIPIDNPFTATFKGLLNLDEVKPTWVKSTNKKPNAKPESSPHDYYERMVAHHKKSLESPEFINSIKAPWAQHMSGSKK